MTPSNLDLEILNFVKNGLFPDLTKGESENIDRANLATQDFLEKILPLIVGAPLAEIPFEQVNLFQMCFQAAQWQIRACANTKRDKTTAERKEKIRLEVDKRDREKVKKAEKQRTEEPPPKGRKAHTDLERTVKGIVKSVSNDDLAFTIIRDVFKGREEIGDELIRCTIREFRK